MYDVHIFTLLLGVPAEEENGVGVHDRLGARTGGRRDPGHVLEHAPGFCFDLVLVDVVLPSGLVGAAHQIQHLVVHDDSVSGAGGVHLAWGCGRLMMLYGRIDRAM